LNGWGRESDLPAFFRCEERRSNSETLGLSHVVAPQRSDTMTDHKKKGDFHKNGKEDVGGNKKQDNSDNSDSRTGNQNAGHGGHK
jgi:hypothetical protein